MQVLTRKCTWKSLVQVQLQVHVQRLATNFRWGVLRKTKLLTDLEIVKRLPTPMQNQALFDIERIDAYDETGSGVIPAFFVRWKKDAVAWLRSNAKPISSE